MKQILRKINQSIFAILATSFVTNVAMAEESHSGLYIEPAITYELGDTHTNYPSPLSGSTGRISGLGLGARLGFHISEVLVLGIDGRYSMPQFKDSSVNYDANSISTNWGPVIGIQMPIVGLRLWGSYILGGELNPEKSGGFDILLKDATGYRVGAGFRVVAVSLNLEYQQLKYGKAILEEVGPFTPGTNLNNVNLENRSWIASVSFPLEM